MWMMPKDCHENSATLCTYIVDGGRCWTHSHGSKFGGSHRMKVFKGNQDIRLQLLGRVEAKEGSSQIQK